MQEVIGELERLRRRARAMLVLQRLSVVAAGVLGVSLAMVLLDYGLRLPSTFRLVLLVGGLGGLAAAVWTYLRPAVGFAPSLTELALRVERSLPRVAGRLASSVEFALSGIDRVNPLAARSVRETQRRWSGESAGGFMTGGRTWRAVGLFGLLAVGVGVAAVASPAAAGTGLARLFVPYGSHEWPARTGVVSLMDDVLDRPGVFPRGQALPLRARVTKGEKDQRVYARYRRRVDDRFEPWRRIVLTHQGAGIHERFVDTNATQIELDFWTEDARTPTRRIELVSPPEVHRATLSVRPPEYAAARVGPIEAELGPGFDERAVTDTPALVGSAVRLKLELNKPLPVPGERTEWLRHTLGWEDDPLPTFRLDPESAARWIVSWRLAGTRRLSLHLVDGYGLTNPEPIGYRIEAVEDHPPRVTITEPETDETVLATAVVTLATEARDDVALAVIGLEAGRESSEAPDEAPPWQRSRTVDAATATLDTELDLSTLDLVEGDVVMVVGLAQDTFELDGETHGVVRSPPRRLRVISELELASQFRRELGAVRQNAIRIEALQAELQDDVIDEGVQPGIDRAQAQIGERVASQRDTVEAIEARRRRNRLEDEQLAALLDQARDLLDFAGRAANRAVESIEQPAEHVRGIVEAQQEVRDELADLIALLDRDEDTWVVTRQLEGLLEQQSQLESETAQVSERTIGRDREDLTPPQRSELDRIADRQQDLRDQARQLLEDLRTRARAVEEVDPESARGMRRAADAGERRQLQRDMETAARRIERNQLRSARAGQQAASATLQRMLEALQETKRARAQQLLRQLASLIQSIERLIVVQASELAALEGARADGDFFGRDRAMIRLTQNTQVVAGEARAAGSQARRIARSLDRAADAQGAAVVALRAPPVVADDVEAAEARSLELLEQARALAQELQQQVEEEEVRRRREDLIGAYRDIAERQLEVRDETVELSAQEQSDRRRLVGARRLGNAQDEIRLDLVELQESTQEITEAAVFDYVHTLIDDWASAVRDALWDGETGARVTERQELIADSLGRLIEALEETLAEPEEFAGQQQGGSGPRGGGQPRPLIPPVAELKLIRGLQEQVYNQTRSLDGGQDLEAAQWEERLRDLGHQQSDLHRLAEEMLQRFQPPAPGGNPGARFETMNPVARFARNAPAAALITTSLAAVAGPRAEPPSTQPESTGVDIGLPSLDELLGLEPAGRVRGTVDVADRERQEELRRQLAEAQLADAFAVALEKMAWSADLLEHRLDPGLGTQRVQEDILLKLDQLIEQARNRQNASTRSSSSQGGQPSDANPMNPGQQPDQAKAGSRRTSNPSDSGQGDPPPRQDGAINTVLEETRTEWGSLPGRIRELMMQGQRGKYSRLYRELTAEYYKRLAQESSF